MSEEHKKIVNDLQKQLDAADVEISRLQRDQQKLQGLPVTPSPQESATSFDLLSQERQEGEVSLPVYFISVLLHFISCMISLCISIIVSSGLKQWFSNFY